MPGNNYTQNRAEITLRLLKGVHEDEAFTQRSAARELGVALGLVNTYLKRCAKKGLVKVAQIPSRRYVYYLTPKGFAEKSRLTAEFLGQSLSLFFQAQNDYRALLDHCMEKKWTKIILFGAGDLAEILCLCSRDYNIEITGIVDPEAPFKSFSKLPVFSSLQAAGSNDAFIITSLKEPQLIFEELMKTVSIERILSPRLLEISDNALSHSVSRKR